MYQIGTDGLLTSAGVSPADLGVRIGRHVVDHDIPNTTAHEDHTVVPNVTTPYYLWTKEGHYTLGFFISIIGICGMTGNSIVLALFARNKSLQTPTNVFIVSLSLSDLAVSVFGNPFSASSSLAKRWLYGETTCTWYGFANTFFGLVSISTLTFVAIDRYLVIVKPTVGSRINIKWAASLCAFAWVYSLIWSVLPFFGISKYTLEGSKTWCSLLWQSDTDDVILYIMLLFVFEYFIPIVIMAYCYWELYMVVRKMARQTSIDIESEAGRQNIKREKKVARMTLLVWIAYLVAWTPYSVVGLKATLGDPNSVGYFEAAMPAVLAKTATVYNPIIYVAMNEHFKRALLKTFPIFRRCLKPPGEEEAGSAVSHSTAVTNAGATVFQNPKVMEVSATASSANLPGVPGPSGETGKIELEEQADVQV